MGGTSAQRTRAEQQARSAPTPHPDLAFATSLWLTFGGCAVQIGSPADLSPQGGKETSLCLVRTSLRASMEFKA
jgi:hypothetical protein